VDEDELEPVLVKGSVGGMKKGGGGGDAKPKIESGSKVKSSANKSVSDVSPPSSLHIPLLKIGHINVDGPIAHRPITPPMQMSSAPANFPPEMQHNSSRPSNKSHIIHWMDVSRLSQEDMSP